MGACNFVLSYDAATAEEGFRILADEAEREYGYDAYNGTISTTSFRGVSTRTAEKCSKTSVNKGYKYIEDKDYGSKWTCRAVDCGVVEYRVTKLKKDTSHKPQPPKYVTRFVVCDWAGNRILDDTFENQTQAKTAIEKAFQRGKIHQRVQICKRPVLVSGKAAVAEFGIETKTYKSRPKSVPAGARLEEVHRYLYYGWASC